MAIAKLQESLHPRIARIDSRRGLERVLRPASRLRLQGLIGESRDKCAGIARAAGFQGELNDLLSNPSFVSMIADEGLDVGLQFLMPACNSNKPKATVEEVMEMVLMLRPGMRTEVVNILCFVHPEFVPYFEGNPWGEREHPLHRVHLRELIRAAGNKCSRIARTAGIQGDWSEALSDPRFMKLLAAEGLDAAGLEFLKATPDCLSPCDWVKLPNPTPEQLSDTIKNLRVKDMQAGMGNLLCFVHPEIRESFQRVEVKVLPPKQLVHLRRLITAARTECERIARAEGIEGDIEKLLDSPRVAGLLAVKGLDAGLKFVRSSRDWLPPRDWLKLPKATVEQLTKIVLELLPGRRAEMVDILCFVHPELRNYFQEDPWSGHLHPVEGVHLRELIEAARDKCMEIARAAGIESLEDPLVFLQCGEARG